MNSKLYVGQVKHRRYVPHEHKFNYRMFMLYLDLDELPGLFEKFLFWSAKGFNLAWFNREHHLGSKDVPLKQSVFDHVYNETGISLSGPVRLLTNLSYFGYGFNPVSFYYCFDESGSDVEVIVAEVNNTPWGEQFCYVLPAMHNKGNPKKQSFELDKAFHVSPFHPMDHNYKWHFTHPDKHLTVHMENYSDDEKIFDATLSLIEQEISSRSLSQVLLGFPFMTVKIITAIYYEALKLWIKRTPVYDHPEKVCPVEKK